MITDWGPWGTSLIIIRSLQRLADEARSPRLSSRRKKVTARFFALADGFVDPLHNLTKLFLCLVFFKVLHDPAAGATAVGSTYIAEYNDKLVGYHQNLELSTFYRYL